MPQARPSKTVPIRSQWTIVLISLSFLVFLLAVAVRIQMLTPLQRYELPRYIQSAITPGKKHIVYKKMRYGFDSVPPLYSDNPVRLFGVPIFLFGALCFASAIIGGEHQKRTLRILRTGRKIAGPDMRTPKQFRKWISKRSEWGLGIGIKTAGKFRNPENAYMRIPFHHEEMGLVFIGSPGSGKTMAIRAILDQLDNGRRFT